MDKVYIDGDILVHRAVWNSSKNEAKKKINVSVASIMEHLEGKEGFIAIKGPDNFRKTVFKGYKGNRKPETDEKKIELFKVAYEHLEEYWGAVPSVGMEADDLIAIWQTETPGVIVSIDKDMLQVPGYHYNMLKHSLVEVTPEEASYNLHIQMLTGDSTDAIKGINGIGPVKAKKLLQGVPMERHLSTVRAAWQKHHTGNWESALQLCTDLVYLKRTHDDRYLIN